MGAGGQLSEGGGVDVAGVEGQEDAADDGHAEGSAGFAGGVVDGGTDAGLAGGRTLRMDSVAGAEVSPSPRPMSTMIPMTEL